MTDLEKELIKMCRALADGYHNGYADHHLGGDEKDACEKAIARLEQLERDADQPNE